MSLVVRPCASVEELRAALVISHYFGGDNRLEDAQWVSAVLRPERMLAAHLDGQVVGGAGAYGVPLWQPGGATVPSTAVTVVGVLPTHRRRGVLTAMMRAQLDDARARGEAVAWLWASEATIYGRFGYGLASLSAEIDLPRERGAFRDPAPGPERVRLVDHERALAEMPGLYDRIARRHAGLVGRDRAWWEIRRLSDHPFRRGDAGPLHRALVERDGQPVGYALYRVRRGLQHGVTQSVVKVVEAVGVDPAAERAAWRYLLDLDWMARIQAEHLRHADPQLLATWLPGEEQDRPALLVLRRLSGCVARQAFLEELQEKGVRPVLQDLKARAAKYQRKVEKYRRPKNHGLSVPDAALDPSFAQKQAALQARADKVQGLTHRLVAFDAWDRFDLGNEPELWWVHMTGKAPSAMTPQLRSWYDRHPQRHPVEVEDDAALAVATAAGLAASTGPSADQDFLS